MSNAESFENIVGGQFPSHEWFVHYCDTYFPNIDPASELGELALGVSKDYALARHELQEFSEGLQYGDEIPDNDETHEFHEKFISAQSRWTVMTSMHMLITESLQTLGPGSSIPAAYDAAVAKAGRKVREELSDEGTIDHLAHERETLQDFVGDVSVLLLEESDRHFQLLRNPSNS